MSSTERPAALASDRPGLPVVRPAVMGDVAELHALVLESQGLLERFDETNAAVEQMVARSESNLAAPATAAQGESLLVIEDRPSGRLVGCIGLTGRIGLEQPFYDYRIGRVVHSSRPLKSYRCLDVLYLCNDLTGASELHSLYVARHARRKGAATQLVKAAQMFIASRPRDCFAPRIVVELRGVADASGQSPFWESVGRHFFRVDQGRAERLVARGNKSFIAELMPKHPVYVAMLPAAAQQSVGAVHEEVAVLAAALERDGFRFESHVDIFDAGRVLEGRTLELAGVSGSRRLRVLREPPGSDAAALWIAAGEGQAFRMVAGAGLVAGGTLKANAGLLDALATTEGSPLLALAR